MGTLTNMTRSVTFLLFLVVGLMIGGSCDEHSLDRRANVVKRADNDTYYNIYTKINTLEKYVSNLETKLQTRTKLLRQVLKSVLELDSNKGLPEKSSKNQNIQTSKRNGNLFLQKSNYIVFIHLYTCTGGWMRFGLLKIRLWIHNSILRLRLFIDKCWST